MEKIKKNMKKEIIILILKEIFSSNLYSDDFNYLNDFDRCFGQYDDQCFLNYFSKYLHCRICKIITESEEN